MTTERRKSELRRHRRKVTGDYFVNYSKYLRPWLYELVVRYKERGIYPILPTMIADYYTDKRDKEVALFASLVIKTGYQTMEHLSRLRKLITEHPWEWFMDRGFVQYSMRDSCNKPLFYRGAKRIELANIMSFLYDMVELYQAEDIEGAFSSSPDAANALYRLSDITNYASEYNIRLILLVLMTSDALGRSLWNIQPSVVKTPLTGKIRRFLGYFFPDWSIYGNIDEAIHLFGFEYDSDFFYAHLAYQELEKKHPKECKRFLELYKERFKTTKFLHPFEWRNFLLPIDL